MDVERPDLDQHEFAEQRGDTRQLQKKIIRVVAFQTPTELVKGARQGQANPVLESQGRGLARQAPKQPSRQHVTWGDWRTKIKQVM